jgi:hypothetical protein
LGDVYVLSREDSGRNVVVKIRGRGGYVIDATVGLGKVAVVRGG